MLPSRHVSFLCFFLVIQLAGCTKPPAKEAGTDVILPHPIFDRTEEELQQSVAILSYLGMQTKPIPDVIFTTDDFDSPLAIFDIFRGGMMTLDSYGYNHSRLAITPAELRRVLRALKPMTSDSIELQIDHVSFFVGRVNGDWIEGYDLKLDFPDVPEMYERIIGALDMENTAGRKAVTEQFHRVVTWDYKNKRAEKNRQRTERIEKNAMGN
jgi:hypothetical protein